MKDNRGFTLIELLVVIAIIGLLSSVVLASLNSARIKGRDARRISDLESIRTALELYYNDHTAYPIAASQTTAATALASVVSGGFIPSISDDPLGGSYHYVYISDAGGTKYCLGSVLEGTAPSGNQSSCSNSLTLTGVQHVVNP